MVNSDSKGHTIGMDVEPNYTYEGGYGRKTFLNVTGFCLFLVEVLQR